MKKILIFIGLKLAEALGICGIVGILYGMGYFVTRVMGWATHMDLWYETIVMGVIPLLMLFGIFAVGFLIYEVIKANWAWADRISKK